MAMINIGTDLNNVKIVDRFQPLPAGEYEVCYKKEGGVREYKIKNGPRAGESFQRFEMELDIINHPEYTGRKIFHKISLDPNFYGDPSGLKATVLAFGGSFEADGSIELPTGGTATVVLKQVVRRKEHPTDDDKIDNLIDRFVGVELEG
jgi:hypothetical protein